MLLTSGSTSRYNGNGVSQEFAYTFRILEESDLLVYVNTVLLVLNSDYTVDGAGDANGGIVHFAVPPPAGNNNVVLERSLPIEQRTHYPEATKFPSSIVERDFDYSAMVDQQINDQLGRAIILESYAVSGGENFRLAENAVARADRFIMFNSDGLGIHAGPTGLDIENAQAYSILANASAVAANASAGLASISADEAEASAVLAAASEAAAAASAAAALASETAAAASETAAAGSASDADASAIASAGSATDSATSATASAGSATASASSATDSASSATASASSATSSASSATASASSATASAGSATASATSAAEAAQSASDAANSAANAITGVKVSDTGGTPTGVQPQLDLREGASIVITVAEDAPNTKINATIAVALATDSVNSAAILASAVTADKVAVNAISETKIAAGGLRTLGTPQATTSGNSKTYAVPSATREFSFMFSNVSLNSAADINLRIGTGGTLTATGYSGGRGQGVNGGTWGVTASTTGLVLSISSAGQSFYGIFHGHLFDASTNKWMLSCLAFRTGTEQGHLSIGEVTLAGAIDIVGIAALGTSVFDLGEVNIQFK